MLDQVDRQIRDAQTIEEEEEAEVRSLEHVLNTMYKFIINFRILQLFSHEQHIMSYQHFT